MIARVLGAVGLLATACIAAVALGDAIAPGDLIVHFLCGIFCGTAAALAYVVVYEL